jgi:hypothetical protein
MNTNVIELLKAEKIATNDFQAAAIANGLKLAGLKTDEERLARARLYRQWRSKTDKKDILPTYQAYDLAIAGIDPADVQVRQIDLTTQGPSVDNPYLDWGTDIQVCPHCGGIDKSTHICSDLLSVSNLGG